MDLDPANVYSLSFHSMYLDLLAWKAVNIPMGFSDVSFSKFCDDQPIELVAYTLASGEADPVHAQQDKRCIFAFSINRVGPDAGALAADRAEVAALYGNGVAVAGDRGETVAGDANAGDDDAVGAAVAVVRGDSEALTTALALASSSRLVGLLESDAMAGGSGTASASATAAVAGPESCGPAVVTLLRCGGLVESRPGVFGAILVVTRSDRTETAVVRYTEDFYLLDSQLAAREAQDSVVVGDGSGRSGEIFVELPVWSRSFQAKERKGRVDSAVSPTHYAALRAGLLQVDAFVERLESDAVLAADPLVDAFLAPADETDCLAASPRYAYADRLPPASVDRGFPVDTPVLYSVWPGLWREGWAVVTGAGRFSIFRPEMGPRVGAALTVDLGAEVSSIVEVTGADCLFGPGLTVVDVAVGDRLVRVCFPATDDDARDEPGASRGSVLAALLECWVAAMSGGPAPRLPMLCDAAYRGSRLGQTAKGVRLLNGYRPATMRWPTARTGGSLCDLSVRLVETALAAADGNPDAVCSLFSAACDLEAVDLDRLAVPSGEYDEHDVDVNMRGPGTGAPMMVCFWVNVYHALLIHALLVGGPPALAERRGPKAARNARAALFDRFGYAVGGSVWTLGDISDLLIGPGGVDGDLGFDLIDPAPHQGGSGSLPGSPSSRSSSEKLRPNGGGGSLRDDGDSHRGGGESAEGGESGEGGEDGEGSEQGKTAKRFPGKALASSLMRTLSTKISTMRSRRMAVRTRAESVLAAAGGRLRVCDPRLAAVLCTGAVSSPAGIVPFHFPTLETELIAAVGAFLQQQIKADAGTLAVSLPHVARGLLAAGRSTGSAIGRRRGALLRPLMLYTTGGELWEELSWVVMDEEMGVEVNIGWRPYVWDFTALAVTRAAC